MFSKIKKYVIGFFVLCGGGLFAFLSGRSAGRKDEKLKGLKKESKRVDDLLKDKIKETDKSIKKTEKKQRGIKKSLESKKKSLEEIKKQRESFGAFNSPTTSAKDAADYLKKYSKEKK